jgi:hypothetical protein
VFIEDGVKFKSCVCVIYLEWLVFGVCNASENLCVCWLPFVLLCVDINLEMYEIGCLRVVWLCYILGAG